MKHFTFIVGFLMGVLLFMLIVMIHNFNVKHDCAAEFMDPFKAYECYEDRKW